MQKKSLIKEQYIKIYKSIDFERKDLFELIKKEFNPKTVFYPGCYIHITPSFYFNHVVYLDKGQSSTEFFSEVDQVNHLINQNKTYKESAYWSFIGKDFKEEPNIRERSFDLVLSIFSGELIRYCEKYTKSNGLILATSLFSDNETMCVNSDYKLIGVIRCRNKKYKIDYSINFKKLKRSILKPRNSGFEYVDNEEYYIYRRKN